MNADSAGIIIVEASPREIERVLYSQDMHDNLSWIQYSGELGRE
jgi:hypothetical protein